MNVYNQLPFKFQKQYKLYGIYTVDNKEREFNLLRKFVKIKGNLKIICL